MDQSYHIPVMPVEVIEALKVEANSEGLFLDGTFGGGGHASLILSQLGKNGRLHGCDADVVAIEEGRKKIDDERLELFHGYFGDLCEKLCDRGDEYSGILFDLGVSSRQLDSDQIGLSYRQEMPLDMRFSSEDRSISAADIVNDRSPQELATLFRTLGEEPAAWKIAKAIERERRLTPIRTTIDLRTIIESIIPPPFLIKTLSRVFQALRIEANDELGELRKGLSCYPKLLKTGGRFVVLTYHSLEDRIVKRAFRDEATECICPPEVLECRCEKKKRLRVITKKPLLPTAEEIERNPRARSAKLRIAERV